MPIRTFDTLGYATAIASHFGFVNAADYATGDGLTDDLAALTEAAGVARANGKDLLIPALTFCHSDTLTFDSVRVFGCGTNSVLKATAAGGSGKGTCVQLIGTAEMHDLEITQPNASVRSNRDQDVGVLVGTLTGVQSPALVTEGKVEGVTVSGAASCGIATRGLVYGEIRRNIVKNTLADGIQVSVRKSDSSNLSGYAVQVQGNIMENTADDGISVIGWEGSTARLMGVNVTGNIVWTQNTAGRGIVYLGALHGNVSDNIVYQPYSHGILVNAGTYNGSKLRDSSHVNVEGNVVVGAGTGDGVGHGIYLGSSTDYPAIDHKCLGNTVESPAGAGIFVESNLDQVSVNGNHLYSCPLIGIHFITASNVQAAHNHLNGIGTTGIQCDTATGSLYIHGNTLEDISTTNSATADAIYVAAISGTPTIKITDNHHVDPNGRTMRDLIRCIFPNVYVSGNTSTAGKPIVLDANQAALFLQTVRVSEGTAIPTAGTWSTGDRVFNTTPSSGGFIGWVCTAGGTPGTWKTFGAIS